ncbi:sensor histidine kinase [Paenibacillus taiwanensis]|uniref:sensor histidine kinase n=1 Tax=Paenibacillus taiwanensis TaxID=401638 RepID=UPI000419E1F5|nr:HAMP domain-containing sensor histidine kinase [Paenibacillus taiwanensis]
MSIEISFFRLKRIFFMTVFLVLCIVLSCGAAIAAPNDERITLSKWEMLWEKEPQEWSQIAHQHQDWKSVDISQDIPQKPAGIEYAWYRISVPKLSWGQSGILMQKVYGFDLQVYSEDGRSLYNSVRNYELDSYQVLLPIPIADQEQEVYLHVRAPGERIGIQEALILGEYQSLLPEIARGGVGDIALGAFMIIAALIMLICAWLVRNVYFTNWLILSVILFCFGILIVLYSDFTNKFYSEYGEIYSYVFDFTLFTLMPALSMYFEKMVGPGPFLIIPRYRKFLIGYTILTIILLLFFTVFQNEKYYDLYFLFKFQIYSLLMVVQLLLLFVFTIIFTIKRNKEAMLFAIGLGLFSITFGGELVWFAVKQGKYDFVFWKWGILGFVIMLLLILARRIAQNHERVIRYSQELEMYNNELQQSDKMGIISELAASIAHEVRNPLQVTRGFIQLLNQRSGDKEKEYISMAVIELDRAAGIITDFLSFAKPQLHEVVLLNVGEELGHIVAVLLPLANMQGAQITLEISDDIYIYGNSSKFKQAFINMVKNSVESLTEAGKVHICTYKKGNKVFVHIKDNGCGMTEQELARLGEPYFTSKAKGTGLGLMVTFRIIEVMNGNIQFNSKKGLGTEVIVEFSHSNSNTPPIPLKQ